MLSPMGKGIEAGALAAHRHTLRERGLTDAEFDMLRAGVSAIPAP